MSLMRRESQSFKAHPIRSTAIWFFLLMFAGSVFWLMVVGPFGVAAALFSTSNPTLLQKGAAIFTPILLLAGFVITLLIGFRGSMRTQSERKSHQPPTLGEVLGEALSDENKSV